MCLGVHKIARSVTSGKHPLSINDTNESLINPIPFNILSQIRLVRSCPESVRLSPFGSTRPGVCWCSVKGHAHRLTQVLGLFSFVYRRKPKVMHRNVCSVKASD